MNYDHKDTKHQILWDVAKEVLGGKFIVINVYIRKEKRFTMNLMFYLRNLEEVKQIKPHVNRWKAVIKVTTDISEKENKR